MFIVLPIADNIKNKCGRMLLTATLTLPLGRSKKINAPQANGYDIHSTEGPFLVLVRDRQQHQQHMVVAAAAGCAGR